MKKLMTLAVLAPCFLFLLHTACLTNQGTLTPGQPPAGIARTCVDKIKQDACPAGSFLDFDAAQGLDCGGELGITIKDEGGKVSGVCGSKDGCKYACKFPPNLCSPNGFNKVTLAEVTCK